MEFRVEKIIEVPESFIERLVDIAFENEIELVNDEELEEVLEDWFYEDIYDADEYYLMVVDKILEEVAERIRKGRED